MPQPRLPIPEDRPLRPQIVADPLGRLCTLGCELEPAQPVLEPLGPGGLRLIGTLLLLVTDPCRNVEDLILQVQPARDVFRGRVFLFQQTGYDTQPGDLRTQRCRVFDPAEQPDDHRVEPSVALRRSRTPRSGPPGWAACRPPGETG